MAGAFSSAFSSAFDVGSAASLPSAPMKGSVGGGLMFARKQLQYIALAGPLLIPAAPVVVPDLSQAFADVPTRRKFDIRHTQSPEFGRADPPPPPAPDLFGGVLADPLRRRPQAWAHPLAQLLPAPAVPGVDWYPSADSPVRRRRFVTPEAFAKPPERPTIPFDPAQQVATLPQPAARPSAHSSLTALTAVPPPAGPPSSALTPLNPVVWEPQLPEPVRLPTFRHPRQPQGNQAQNLVPLPQAAPPELSWQPSADPLPNGLKRRPWLEAFAQNVEPLNTPAYLASFWLSYPPTGPFPKRGLLTAIQQAVAEAPPIIEITVIVGAWRPEAPALLLRPARLVPEGSASVQDLQTLANAYGCMTLSQIEVTSPQLLSVEVTGALLLNVSVRHATLLIHEVC